MEALSISQKAPSIQWKQLWSLAALYGSVVIGWIAYQNYQPRLLEQFHFTQFTFLLAIAEGVILVVTPPLAGRLGDRYRVEKGHRIPVITAGISFASMIFMAVAFTLLSNPGEVFKWILPVLIVFWLIAMSIFTSPALSTMELFAPIEKLPRAMAVLTIVGNFVYALEPVIVDIIDYLGAPLTFLAGGGVVFISGYALKKTSLALFQHTESQVSDQPAPVTESERSYHGFIFLLGCALGLVTTVLFNFFPEWLYSRLGAIIHVDGKIMIVWILATSALLSLPISNLVNRIGLVRAFRISFVIAVASIVCIFFSASLWLVILLMIVFAASFTSLSVSSLPLAIGRAGFHEKVFCVGIFFSGTALPDGIVNAWQAL